MGLDPRMAIAIVAKGADSFDAVNRAFRGNGNVFEGQRRDRLAETAQHLLLETFDVYLAELRLAMPCDELVECDQGDANGGIPLNSLESPIGLDVADPGIGETRNSRRTATQMKIALPGCCRYSAGLDGDGLVTPIEQSQNGNEVGLRLNRDHTGTDPSKNAYPVAHVGPNVEGQIAWMQKLPVENCHPLATPKWAVIGDQRASDAANAADQMSPWHSVGS